MSKLSSCSECSGFLPPQASACPNCGQAVVARPKPMPKPLRGVLALGAGGLLAMTLSACYGGGVYYEDAGPPCTDNDGDGYCVSDGDCDDTDFEVRPFAPDPLGDMIDQNCDGVDGTAGDAGP